MLSSMRIIRRHRITIGIAVLIVIGLYQFATLRSSSSSFAPDRLNNYIPPPPHHAPPEKPLSGSNPPAEEVSPPIQTSVEAPKTIPERPATRPGGHHSSDHDQHLLPEEEPEHYSFPKPHYPVPSPLIKIPAAAAVAIPQIQATFPAESAADKATREARQKSVRDAFLVSWNAYRDHAIPHDELLPASGLYKDPFGGWGATLVDALDTLWIMGLKKEFEEALGYVKKIDFTTTTMRKMRVFETVIRYLGGLIAAWDISGHNPEYKVLLDKAIELADIMMGTFDTPNRMPILMYGWRERDLARHPRADARAVAAEMGTLSMEFTRLAQITGNMTYYDAVARIANELEAFQDKTTFPGLYPIYIDASGCKKVRVSTAVGAPPVATTLEEKPAGDKAETAATPSDKKKPAIVGGNGKEVEYKPFNEAGQRQAKRAEPATTAFQDINGKVGNGLQAHNPRPSKLPVVCEPQGLAHVHLGKEDKYGLGAMIDSLYEYLLKQYLLLGGNEQYKKMYSKAMDIAGDALTYRPFVPGNPDILLAGDVYVSRLGGPNKPRSESSHLACFAGGMFAMGAKALGRSKDLKIGSKLTDGCVWAYSSMRSGIMPETFKVMACKSKKECTFSREEWVTALEPPPMPAYGSDNLDTLPKLMDDAAPVLPADRPATATPPANAPAAPPTPDIDSTPVHEPAKRAAIPPQRSVKDARAAREYAEDLIATEDLPEGFLEIGDRRYILRPEAVESVWYMYRISAEKEWANKGWGMWESVLRAVGVEGNGTGPASAIADVTLSPDHPDWDWLNSMESFWFGETLKYYYLLFSDPSVVSLDDYVLNTEAHPLRRADYGRRGKTAAA